MQRDGGLAEALLSDRKPFYSKENPFQKNVRNITNSIKKLLEKKDFTSLKQKDIADLVTFSKSFSELVNKDNLDLKELKSKIEELDRRASSAFEDYKKNNVITTEPIFDEDGTAEYCTKYTPEAAKTISQLKELTAQLLKSVTAEPTRQTGYVPPTLTSVIPA